MRNRFAAARLGSGATGLAYARGYAATGSARVAFGATRVSTRTRVP